MKRRSRACRPCLTEALEPRVVLSSSLLQQWFGPLFGQKTTEDDPNQRPFWEKWNDHTDPLAPDKPAPKAKPHHAAGKGKAKAKSAVGLVARPGLHAAARAAKPHAAGAKSK